MFQSQIERFRNFLKQRNERFTRQRQRVFMAVFSMSFPFTVEQLLKQLRSVERLSPSERVSLATLYRTMKLLEQCGLLSRRTKPYGKTLFFHQLMRSETPKKTSPYSELCAREHNRLIAGKCPWCGRTVFENRMDESTPKPS